MSESDSTEKHQLRIKYCRKDVQKRALQIRLIQNKGNKMLKQYFQAGDEYTPTCW